MNRSMLAAEDRALREELAAMHERKGAIELRRQRIAEALLIEIGLHEDALATASRILDVRGSPNSTQRKIVVQDAKDAIASGGGRLLREYFGTKDYCQFHDQREDHSYGFGPSYGSMVFEIRLRPRRGEPLSANEIEACLYALDAISQGRITDKQLALLRSEPT